MAGTEHLRGHPFKLQRKFVHTEVRRNAFSQRVVGAWNGLPEDVVSSAEENENDSVETTTWDGEIPLLNERLLRKVYSQPVNQVNKDAKETLMSMLAWNPEERSSAQQVLTYFNFAGETYEQIKGTPMYSPISGLVAELVLQELEKIAFTRQQPIFWRRYVDDTFVILKSNMLQHFHDHLNSIFPDIQFTSEEKKEQQLPFLDVLVRRRPNGEIETAVYRKATNTTQLLNCHSNHPVAHKAV
ncbi:unnamed protein product [Schistocephalus solidus]|uniref:Reverse transcriptase domain-containing protein n=1 Tax=Schistocephalus solidus TaxID=70667 RepID=A0A3P7ELV9_SCHSO|nr:unnamed protein product [Schistocephalus solidus]